ncbi:phosphatidate cytidylyltransferase [Janibacter sp. G56]|uniref:phosphatidate cytidylyltransferase n=1 Tax=Janibacter sp. G56 TaxID=3418717 RepID=UPI003CFEB6C0
MSEDISPPETRRARNAQLVAPAAAGRPSRAGRNLRAAIGVGVGLALLVIASLLRPPVFVAVAAVAIVLGARELKEATARAGLNVPLVPVAVGSVSMLVAGYLRGPESLTVATVLTCVAVLVWRVADGLGDAARDIGAGILVVFYPGLLAGFAALMIAEPDGVWRIVMFILVTVCSDIGGYAAGVRLGKHPMAPSLSPKKSWEGFAGSVVLSSVVAAVAGALMLDVPWWGGLLLGALVAVAATIGDLIESSIKRDLGIKDMSNLLPGHGGIMDRLDSLLVCAPIVWALLHVLEP